MTIREKGVQIGDATIGLAVWSCVVAFILLGPGAVMLQGQAQGTATLSGLVSDQTAAAVPEAAVTLSSPEKGFTRTFTTATDGRFIFPLIPAGQYVLSVEKAGFRRYEQKGIVLALAESANQNVTLQVGEITQVVDVSSAAEILNTNDANVSTDVSELQAKELPLNWRHIYQLTLLDSSVVNVEQHFSLPTDPGNSPQDGGIFTFGGGRLGTTAFLLDGHWNAAGDWDALMFVPSVDEVQELKVQSYTFTAQYGLSLGNFVNAITKSGTNKLHGSVFEFLRNSALDSNYIFNRLNGIEKPAFRRNQFGFTVGGPLYIPRFYQHKDKTFFFVSMEFNRQTSPATFIATVPTAAFRTGDFSALLGSSVGTDALGRPVQGGAIYDPQSTRLINTGQADSVTGLTATCAPAAANGPPAPSCYIRDPFPGNMIPNGRIDPLANNLLQYWPNPTNGGLDTNFVVSKALPLSSTSFTGRVDHNFNDKSRIFGRWSFNYFVKAFAGNYFGDNNPAGPGTGTPNDRWDAALGYNYVFSPSLVMSVTAGWNRWDESFSAQGVNFLPSTLGLPSFLDVAKGFPTIQIAGTYGLGRSSNVGYRTTETLSIDFTKRHGPHIMNFGFQTIAWPLFTAFHAPPHFQFSQSMTLGPDPVAGNPNTGYGFASYLLGAGDSGSTTVYAQGNSMKRYFAGYFQDDWKVNRKLTLNLGLRYDMQTAPVDRSDRMAQFQADAVNPLSQDVGFNVPGQLAYTGGNFGRGVYSPQHNNFGPRVGFAYKLTDKLVMRGGFGLFYTNAIQASDYQGLDLYGFTQTTPWVATIDGIHPNNLLSNPYPDGLLQPVGKAAGGLTQVGEYVDAVDPHRSTPYVEQWLFGFQYGLTNNDVLDVSYVGNHGVKLTYGDPGNGGAIPLNQLTPENLAIVRNAPPNFTVNNPFFGFITSSACGLDQPTVLQSQLLRPFPQYCGVTGVQTPEAGSRYDALRINYMHRWSNGLHMLGSFTASKYISQSLGPQGWCTCGPTGVLDSYNLSLERSLDNYDIPKALVVSLIYELPVGRGKKFGANMNSVTNAVLGGWQVSGVVSAKDGFPVGILDGVDNTNSYGGTQRPNLVGNPNAGTCSNGSPVHTINCWFNDNAFAQPDAYTFGNLPRTLSNVRIPSNKNLDITVQKWWPLHGENTKMQFRMEFYNALNHVNFLDPDSVFGSPTFGQILLAAPGRSIQAGLKIYW